MHKYVDGAPQNNTGGQVWITQSRPRSLTLFCFQRIDAAITIVPANGWHRTANWWCIWSKYRHFHTTSGATTVRNSLANWCDFKFDIRPTTSRNCLFLNSLCFYFLRVDLLLFVFFVWAQMDVDLDNLNTLRIQIYFYSIFMISNFHSFEFWVKAEIRYHNGHLLYFPRDRVIEKRE